MKQTRIVIVTGKAQAGKDTTCDYMMEKLTKKGYKCKKYAFATYLKNMCVDLFGLTPKQVYGSNDDKNSTTQIKWEQLPFDAEVIQHLKVKHVAKNNYLTARQFMQIFGSDICRYIDSDCWCRATLKEIESDKNVDFAFICDARFPNEINFFLKYDPIIIRLLRNLFDSKHISETALDNYEWDDLLCSIYIVDNSDMLIQEKNSFLDKILENL